MGNPVSVVECTLDNLDDVKIIVELTKFREGGMGRSVDVLTFHLECVVPPAHRAASPSSPLFSSASPAAPQRGDSVLSTASSPLPLNSTWHIGCWKDG